MKGFDLKQFNNSEARQRVLSAVVLAPIVIGVIWLGGVAYAGLVALVAATGLYEWLRLVDPNVSTTDRNALFGVLILAMLLAACNLPTFSFIVIALATAGFYAHRSMGDPEHARWFAAGIPYMAGGGVALVYLRNTPDTGLGLTAYLFAVAWGMDIGGYFCGRIIGGRKLAPTISPNKTWAGFVGGIVLAAIFASIVLIVTGATSYIAALMLAMLLAVTAQGGDLFKSFFKRKAGVKDCGNLIPGHGGVLDRIDGLVFAALFLAILRLFFGPHLIG